MRRIFGSFDKADLAEPYFTSMEMVSDAQFYLIQYKRDGQWFEDFEPQENLKVFRKDKKYPGNTGKLNDWFALLPDIEIHDDDWCIFTDVHDVVFQRDIPELSKNVSIYACYEGKVFGEVPFWKSIYPASMMDKRVYNCGIFAMNPFYFREYLQKVHEEYEKIKKWKTEFRAETIGIGFPFNSQYATDVLAGNIGNIFNGVADTYIYNNFIKNIVDVVEWKDACCYNFSIEKGFAKMKYRKLCNLEDKPFAIAHYNGDAKNKNI